jgi:hypothetical protein
MNLFLDPSYFLVMSFEFFIKKYVFSVSGYGGSVYIFFKDKIPNLESQIGFYPKAGFEMDKIFNSMPGNKDSQKTTKHLLEELRGIARQKGFIYSIPDFFIEDLFDILVKPDPNMYHNVYLERHFDDFYKFVLTFFEDIESDKFYEPL